MAAEKENIFDSIEEHIGEYAELLLKALEDGLSAIKQVYNKGGMSVNTMISQQFHMAKTDFLVFQFHLEVGLLITEIISGRLGEVNQKLMREALNHLPALLIS